jgi:pimeloyl-ACP methyl ester carboxylesterase
MRELSQSKTCLIGGKKIHYVIYNPDAKKTIVAVHGLRGTHHGLSFIAQKLPEYTFIVPDLPGHGESEAFDDVHSIDNYARWLAAFIEYLDVPADYVVLGHSFGTIIVSKLATSRPDLIKKLILINPIAAQTHPGNSFFARNYYRLAGHLPENIGTRLLRSRLITRVITINMVTAKRKRLKKRVYDQHLAHFSSFFDRRSAIEAFEASLATTVSDYAAHLSMPTLLIVGAKDTIVPISTQHALHASLKNAKLKVIPYVGHLIHYETPELAARYIEEFVG